MRQGTAVASVVAIKRTDRRVKGQPRSSCVVLCPCTSDGTGGYHLLAGLDGSKCIDFRWIDVS